MQQTDTTRRSLQGANRRPAALQGFIGLLLIGLGSVAARGAEAPPAPIAIAVFDFELDDVTPASAFLQRATSSAPSLQKATDAAKRELSRSGLYQVIAQTGAPSAARQPAHLKDCDGCEAAMALQLGAQQSLIGIVRRATQTDYYVTIAIRDAHTGKLVNQQSANFAGGEEGWATGVRVLLDHQILYPDQPERLSTPD
jgi:hypothetical protein